MDSKGALDYLPIVPKVSLYVPKVMHKPVMGDNTMYERLSRTCFSSEGGEECQNLAPQIANLDMMAEYGREGCVELSSHCAQSLHICPKGNAQTSYG